MRSILKITTILLIGLAACSSEPGQHATYMPGTAGDNSMMMAPATAPVPATDPNMQASAAQAPAANTVPPPNGVVMPTAEPPVPAYGDPTVPHPYYYPPVGMGVHVPR